MCIRDRVGVGLIRQHLHPGDQIHGIVTDGGDAPNIVPSHSTARYIVRASGVADLERLQGQVHRCFEAGALATGATLEIEDHGPPYTEFNHDNEIALLYKANAEVLGRRFSPRLTKGAASADMANVSLLMPTIHPSIGLDCAPAVNHQPEFTQHCKTEDADDSMIHGAIAMAQTCIDVATTDTVRDRLLGNDTTYGGRGSDYPWRF